MTSPNFSFNGWKLWEFIKGRKRMVITVVSMAIGYFITDSGTVAIVSGGVVESVFALAAYFCKKYN